MDAEDVFIHSYQKMILSINQKKKQPRYDLYQTLYIDADSLLWCEELRILIKELRRICSREKALNNEPVYSELAFWIEFLGIRYEHEQQTLHASMDITERVKQARNTIDKATRLC